MTTHANVDPIDTVGAIARCRYIVLKRAGEILNDEVGEPLASRADALPNVSALLMTSLEELKIAEEELRLQNAMLEQQRAAVDDRVRHYRQLFLHSPSPSFVTDIYGSIQEVNLAAANLFRRQAQYLERKPLAALLGPDFRDEFRRQLTRVTAEGVRDWRLLIKRVGDVPIEAHATVRLVPGIGATGAGLLYWMLSVPERPN